MAVPNLGYGTAGPGLAFVQRRRHSSHQAQAEGRGRSPGSLCRVALRSGGWSCGAQCPCDLCCGAACAAICCTAHVPRSNALASRLCGCFYGCFEAIEVHGGTQILNSEWALSSVWSMGPPDVRTHGTRRERHAVFKHRLPGSCSGKFSVKAQHAALCHAVDHTSPSTSAASKPALTPM